MAVGDSQQKRMSALGHGRPFTRSVFPVSAKDAPWRLNVGMVYAGNELSPGAGQLLIIPHHYRAGFNQLHAGYQA